MSDSITKEIIEDIVKEVEQTTGKTVSEDVAKQVAKDVSKQVTADVAEKIVQDLDKTIVKEGVSAAEKDVISSVKTEIAANRVGFFSKAKIMLQDAGKIMKDYPKLTAAGLTAAGVAIYAAAKGISFKQACINLLQFSKDQITDLAKDLNDVACQGLSVCPSQIWKWLKWVLLAAVIIGIIWLISKGIKSTKELKGAITSTSYCGEDAYSPAIMYDYY